MISFLFILLMGFVLGLLGGGGSILTVPILVYIFKINAVKATAYSLFVVGTAACVGAFKNYRYNNLDIKTGLSFAIPGFLGVFCSRAFIVANLPQIILQLPFFSLTKDVFIMLVFAVMMILASYSMIFGRSEKKASKKPSLFFIAPLGFCVGLATGFVGAGGGFIIIPILVSLVGLDVKKAIGTSLFIISINSIIGFSGDALSSSVDWLLLFKLSAFAIAGILIGSTFSTKVPAKVLKKAFGVFVLILGSLIIYKQI